jgi:P27 family predicted phage terminase small subunit
MPGPKPMPIPLRILRGNPGRRPIPATFDPPRLSEPPAAPSFLSGYAVEEWNRIVPGLCLFGLLSEVDVMPLAAYCVSYHRWRTAVESLDAVAMLDPMMHGLLVKGSEGQARDNPLVRIAASAAGDMVRYASEFGFSPAARSRIVAGPRPGPSKFDGLLAE